MKERRDRVSAIISIIKNNRVSSQEELLQLLEKEGIKTTQSTLSRDFRLLKITKQVDHKGKYAYTIGGRPMLRKDEELIREFPVSGFQSIAFSENIAVIKTTPGFANGVASIIDNRHVEGLLGTIAGDDTIIVILEEGANRKEIARSISLFIPEIDLNSIK